MMNVTWSFVRCHIAEKDLIKYAEHKDFPIIPCNLCGSQENLQRQSIKAMLTEWDKNSRSC